MVNKSAESGIRVPSSLVIDWPEWLRFSGLDRLQRLHIREVPETFFPVDILPCAFQLLESGGLLVLEFVGETDTLALTRRMLNKAHNFGFEPEFSATGVDYSRCMAFVYTGEARANKILVKSTTGYESELITLFGDVFGHPISSAHWRWKYPLNTENQSLIALAGEHVIAHYGVSPRNICVSGNHLLAAQVGDIMVDSSHRGGLVTSSYAQVAYITMMQMQEQISEDPLWTDYTVGFGFPHGRHMKMARRLALYNDGGNVHLVRFLTSNAPGSSTFSLVTTFDDALKRIWNSANKQLKASLNGACMVDRSWLYLLERYRFHPQNEYQIAASVDAVFVLSLFPDGIYRVVDYIGDIAALTENISQLAALLKVSEIRMWLMEWVSQYIAGSDTVKWNGVKASLALMYTRGSSFEQFKDIPWWITLGDADFI